MVSWLNGGKLLIVCNNASRFGDQRDCGSEEIMFLIYHVASHNRIYKR